MIIPLIAVGFLLRADYVRMQRVARTTNLFAESPKLDAGSPTGYAGGVRELIVPERNNDSYHWIIQSQQMLAQGEWRLRHVNYDNAPAGRAVDSPAPYRWWLGMAAWLEHAISGRPMGAAVERAAIFADPLLHLVLIVALMIFVAWRFGIFPAALAGAGLATFYPLTGWFVPGAPDDNGLSLACSVWSLLPLLAGVRVLYHSGQAGSDPATAGSRAIRWFHVAGIMGGIGVWVGVERQMPIITGIFLGGLIAAWATRRDSGGAPVALPWAKAWQAWAFAGATTILAACLIEYFPSHLDAWQLQGVHPVYGLAWLGLGAILIQVSAWIRQEAKPSWQFRPLVRLTLAIAAVALLPLLMWKMKNAGFLATQVSSFRLDKLSDSPVGVSLLGWLIHDGITSKAWATLLPVLLVVPAGWIVAGRSTRGRTRVMVAIALGPVLIALALVGRHLNGWSFLDGVLLTLLIATAAADEIAQPRAARWMGAASLALIMILGLIQLSPSVEPEDSNALQKPEVIGLIERDMAHWLAKHVSPGKGLVLAPPAETTALCYYGGLRGLGTLARENQDGIGVAVRIASASTPEEAKELIDSRGVTHLVIPSWDSTLDEYARIGMGEIEGTFLSRLHAWRIPLWLRPIAYQLPNIAGFEGQSVRIFEVVENQGDAASLSRIAEYFVESGDLNQAAAVGEALRQFPADLGALVARAQVEFARSDTAGFTQSVERLRPRLTGAGERRLPWDRRVGLAVVLMQAKQAELARTQVQHCLADADEKKLRSLPTGSLFRLQVLGKAFGLGFPDLRLHQLALDLLPPDMRQRLQPSAGQ